MRILGLPIPRAALACAALAICSLSTLGQVRHPGVPAVSQLAERAMPVLDVEPPDVSAYQDEDAYNLANRVPGPLRFGVPLAVPFVFEQAADWQLTEDGALLVGRLEIRAPGAFSLQVEMEEFDIPADGKLFFYDPAMTMVLGAYTQEERIHDGSFVVEPLVGDRMIIEYSQPAQGASLPHMAVRTVIYDYRDVFELERLLDTYSGGYSGGCSTVNVNCPEGDPYPLQKRSTVRTIFGGGLCSGMLINNTENDGTQYLYTANHCGTGSGVTVRFNYQTSGCGGGGAPTNQNVSGAVLLANDTDTDGRFLRITNTIPDSYNPYFAGWSRSNANLTFGMSMHHPGGGTKKISIDINGGGMSTGNFIGIGTVKVWDMAFQTGSTSGGSSGGPLYDQNDRIRGTLTGGPDGNCAISLYGRFHNFWNDVGLGQWLDPQGSGVTSIDGFDPYADLAPPNLALALPNSGPVGGFTDVNLSGTGLDGVLSVTFGGIEAVAFTENSTSSVTARTPPGVSTGLVDIVLTDSMGSSTLNNAFNYTANPTPDMNTVTPDVGDVAGGEIVTLTGPSAVGVTDVQFDGVSGTTLSILDAGTLEVTTPAGSGPGPVDVTVFGNGSDTLVDGYTYTAAGTVEEAGVGHPGLGGIIVPDLNANGDLVPGGSGFTLTCGIVSPNAIGALFASLAFTPVPFKGGFLYTIPIELNIPVQASFIGTVSVPVPLDASLPGGLEFWVQMAFAEAAASHGVSISNGLKITLGEN
jgi:hypothetical protein